MTFTIHVDYHDGDKTTAHIAGGRDKDLLIEGPPSAMGSITIRETGDEAPITPLVEQLAEALRVWDEADDVVDRSGLTAPALAAYDKHMEGPDGD